MLIQFIINKRALQYIRTRSGIEENKIIVHEFLLFTIQYPGSLNSIVQKTERFSDQPRFQFIVRACKK